MYTINIESSQKIEFIEISRRIQEIISKGIITEGICFIFVPHTTAGITINEDADAAVAVDITDAMNRLFDSMQFQHVEGNSPGHVKSTVVGCSTSIPISNRKLMLGTWQGIFFCEFDGPRNRKVHVQLLPTQ